ncbi:MAG: riboflavin synthase [Chitinophagales bacterium]|nr:riboflavin synthase [Chitinophagales bacterium]
MFTGIIEDIGKVVSVVQEGTNVHLEIACEQSAKLKVDQSVSHNGVCLTVVKVGTQTHTVTAIKETLEITNLRNLLVGDFVNIELAMKQDSRLDGHFVQGHVDQTALCTGIKPKDGSWEFHFEFAKKPKFHLVNKGSVCINGVSLTVVKTKKRKFHVAIIPYTYEHTSFKYLKEGDIVNIEFDVLGKYVERQMKAMKK